MKDLAIFREVVCTMTPDEIRETIKNYPVLISEIERLRKSLGSSQELNGRDFFSSISSGFERKIKRLEQLERNVLAVQRILGSDELTDREWSFLDCLLDGMTITKASDHVCFSNKSGTRCLDSIVNKIVNSQGY